MKVSVRNLNVSMDLGNDGIELDVRSPDDTEHLGHLRIGKAKIEWCEGKKKTGNGIEVNWDDLLAFFKKAEKKQSK